MTAFARWLLFATLCGVSLTTWCEGVWTTVWVLASVLALVVLLRVGQRGFDQAAPRAEAIQWILLGAVAWAFVQAYTQWSVYRYETIAAATQWCGMAGIFYICGQAFRSDSELWMERFVFFAGAVSALCLAERFSSNGRFLWLFDTGYPDIYGPFASYKDHAVLIELAFPAALLATLKGGPRRSLHAGVSGLMIASVIMSTSRAGVVLVTAEALVIFLIAAIRKPESRRRLITGGALVATVAVSLSLAAGWEELWSRMQQKDAYAFRRQVLISSVEMIRERPWTGFGMGNFATAYPAYAHFDDGTRVNHTHNEWAEWAVEGGIPLALAMAAMLALTVRPAFRTVWGMGVIAVLLHSLVDYPLRRFGVVGWFFFVLAAIHASHRREARHSWTSNREGIRGIGRGQEVAG